MAFQVIGSIIICIYFNIFTLPVIIIIISLEIYFSFYCLQPLKDISRLEGNYRAPLIGVFSETLSGLNIIRSFQYENKFINKFNNKMNEYFKICIFQSGISGWYGIILDMISFCLLTFILISCLLFKEKYSPQSIGLLLTYSLNIIKHLFNFMGRLSGLNKMLISVERCENFTKIPQEKYPILNTDIYLPTYPSNNGKERTFISKGKINFLNYSVKYRPNTPLVLRNLTFEIKPKEKIGVVGRTGSGKSTLCLSLFRILEANSGKISIDGIDISEIGLEILRKNLTIIPQEPILIEGSLRNNIDPTNCYSDKEIIEILSEVGLDEFFVNKNLDFEVEDNGMNISIGEKQLICIARALIKKTKIILMDEATANIDYKTETFLQNSINKELKDCTVITIAHRIKTIINYDRILVLNNGEIVEFDSPQNLLDKKGLFYQLYKESIV
jgi:ABC-type multidrug transport system fused ATPase/permease subunit